MWIFSIKKQFFIKYPSNMGKSLPEGPTLTNVWISEVGSRFMHTNSPKRPKVEAAYALDR